MHAFKRSLLTIASISASLLALGAQALWAEPKYIITDIGSLGGNIGTEQGINNQGQVTGSQYLYSNGVLYGLGSLDTTSNGFGINNLGQVTGFSYNALSQQHAIISTNGFATDLGTLGGTQSAGFGINDLGQIVGASQTANGKIHGFFYTNGVMTDLNIPDGDPAVAKAINQSGQIVGWRAPSQSSSHTSAFLYKNGVVTDLGTLGGTTTYAFGINDSGQIVGGSFLSDFSTYHPFLYDKGVITDLGSLGGRNAAATGINNHGTVVGYSTTTPFGTVANERAFIYQNGTITELDTLIDGNPGWILLRANAINDSGQIVGNGTLNGVGHGFLLTPNITAPKGVTATAVSSSRIDLAWQSVPNTIRYNIFRSTSPGSYHTYLGSSTTLQFSDTNLSASTSYYYIVAPDNNGATGSKSLEVSATTFVSTIPGALSNLTVSSVSNTQVTLKWSAASGATGYSIFRSPFSGQYHTYIGQTTSLTFTNTGLVSGSTYYYNVIPTNAIGNGPKSPEVDATTSLLPDAPGNLTATTVSKTQINLTWVAADGTTNYTVYRSTSPGAGRVIVGQTTTATSFADTHLQPATRYYYVVVAGNASGYTKSNEVSAVTDGVPGLPSIPNLTATTVSKTQINLSWTTSSDAASYTIYRSTTPGGLGRVIIGQTTGLSFHDTTLQTATRYYYVVVAGNASGYTKSNEVSARTVGIPGAPINLSATLVGTTHVLLQWQGSDGATTNTIYRAPASGGPGRVIIGQTNGSTFQFLDTTAQGTTIYFYVVVSGNAYGYTKSSEVPVITQVP